MAERMTIAQAQQRIEALETQIAALKKTLAPLLADFQVQQAQMERQAEAKGEDVLPRHIQERRAAVAEAMRGQA